MAMIEDDWKAMENAIVRMTADEKQRLLTAVARALTVESTPPANEGQSLQALLVEMESLPVARPDDGFSNRAHDSALYGDRR
jgi:hypothetical protein